ncbi:hypothetical protein Halhy_6482 [Haliscomenobacter hydrossis DSM 1100]|uniref:Uncharacterized protein n=1 Tax=Haliscomenobacter hydrossis (strain ATCC 27775 / DSM 1100 / LMG 10767 / O) TaxID=760192 RepID=F4KRB1_HALH1|nr:hypothetical protein Halhy_6482 [Haliscomenobacter hydrossis DSM 1100]
MDTLIAAALLIGGLICFALFYWVNDHFEQI